MLRVFRVALRWVDGFKTYIWVGERRGNRVVYRNDMKQ